MPDNWRCECGYTNLGSKTCLVCRRPRQAVPPREPEARIDEPPPPVEKKARKAKAAAKKRPARKKAT
jgi:hypothetical protein